MIQNIIVGLLYATISFLFASANTTTQPYAIFVALALLALGFLLSYYKQKKDVEDKQIQNQHLESINKTLSGLLTKSDFDESRKKQMSDFDESWAKLIDLLIDFKENTLKHQQTTSDELTLLIKGFEEALTLFQESASAYTNLTQTVRDDLDRISKKTEAVPDMIVDSFNKTIADMAKSVDDSFESINLRTAEVMEKHTQMIDKFLSCAQKTIQDAIADISETTATRYENVNRSLFEANKQNIQKQTETIQLMHNSVMGAVEKMKQSILDIRKSTSEMTDTITETLERIDDSTTKKLEGMKSEIEEAVLELSSEVSTTIATLTDQLTSIVARCTDYQKEKEIVSQLEKLCRK